MRKTTLIRTTATVFVKIAFCWTAIRIQSALGLRIHCLIADHRACNGPDIEFCDDLAVDGFQPEFQGAVLSIVRELLLNVRCHSKSKNVLLGLTQDDGNLFVQVQDWGIGFDPENVHPRTRTEGNSRPGWMAWWHSRN